MAKLSARKKPEILIVTPPFGTGRRNPLTRIISELEKEDFDFTWAARLPAHHKAPMLATQTVLPLTIIGMKKQLRPAIERADIVCIYDAPHRASTIAHHLAQEMKKPIIMVHHIHHGDNQSLLKTIYRGLINQFLTKDQLVRANQTIFISESLEARYHRHLDVPAKIIPYGVNHEVFTLATRTERWALRGKFALRDNQPVLMFVGPFTRENGILTIKELAHLCPRWRFWLVGQTTGDKVIDPTKWQMPNIHIFPGRAEEDRAKLYQSADILVVPGTRDSFPEAVAEAMGCGLPVICSPLIASANKKIEPLLMKTKIIKGSAKASARAIAQRLMTVQSSLPLEQNLSDLSATAQILWQWEETITAYKNTFRAVMRK